MCAAKYPPFLIDRYGAHPLFLKIVDVDVFCNWGIVSKPCKIGCAVVSPKLNRINLPLLQSRLRPRGRAPFREDEYFYALGLFAVCDLTIRHRLWSRYVRDLRPTSYYRNLLTMDSFFLRFGAIAGGGSGSSNCM